MSQRTKYVLCRQNGGIGAQKLNPFGRGGVKPFKRLIKGKIIVGKANIHNLVNALKAQGERYGVVNVNMPVKALGVPHGYTRLSYNAGHKAVHIKVGYKLHSACFGVKNSNAFQSRVPPRSD